MSASEVTAGAPTRSASQMSFFLRKLHSLTGVVPVGAYLCFHMYENLKVIFGPAAYDQVIEDVAHMAPRPWFYLMELGVVILPLTYHAVWGLVVWWQGQSNAVQYPYRRAWLYWAQRWSGIITFAFIAYHFYALRWPTLLDWWGFEATPATYAMVREHFMNPWVWAFYALGTVSAAFHFGNGLYGFAFSWGLAIGRKAQMAWEVVGWGVTVVLAAASLHILWVFVR